MSPISCLNKHGTSKCHKPWSSLFLFGNETRTSFNLINDNVREGKKIMEAVRRQGIQLVEDNSINNGAGYS